MKLSAGRRIANRALRKRLKGRYAELSEAMALDSGADTQIGAWILAALRTNPDLPLSEVNQLVVQLVPAARFVGEQPRLKERVTPPSLEALKAYAYDVRRRYEERRMTHGDESRAQFIVHSPQVVETLNFDAAAFLHGTSAGRRHMPWCGGRTEMNYERYGGEGKRRFLVYPNGPTEVAEINGVEVPFSKYAFVFSLRSDLSIITNVNDPHNAYPDDAEFLSRDANKALDTLNKTIGTDLTLQDIDTDEAWADAGINNPAAWIAAGFNEVEAAEPFYRAEFGPKEAAAWYEAGISGHRAALFRDQFGFDVQEATPWNDALRVALTMRPVDEKHAFDGFKQIHEAGLTPKDAIDIARVGGGAAIEECARGADITQGILERVRDVIAQRPDAVEAMSTIMHNRSAAFLQLLTRPDTPAKDLARDARMMSIDPSRVLSLYALGGVDEAQRRDWIRYVAQDNFDASVATAALKRGYDFETVSESYRLLRINTRELKELISDGKLEEAAQLAFVGLSGRALTLVLKSGVPAKDAAEVLEIVPGVVHTDNAAELLKLLTSVEPSQRSAGLIAYMYRRATMGGKRDAERLRREFARFDNQDQALRAADLARSGWSEEDMAFLAALPQSDAQVLFRELSSHAPRQLEGIRASWTALSAISDDPVTRARAACLVGPSDETKLALWSAGVIDGVLLRAKLTGGVLSDAEARMALPTEPKQAQHKRTAADDAVKQRIQWREHTLALEVLGGETREAFHGPVELPKTWTGYGFFEGVPAEDGDSLDVLVGPRDLEGPVFVARQVSDAGSQWKVLLGFGTLQHAKAAFELMWPGLYAGLVAADPDTFERVLFGQLRVAQRVMTFLELPVGAKFVPVSAAKKGVAEKLDAKTYRLLGQVHRALPTDLVMQVLPRKASRVYAHLTEGWSAGERAAVMLRVPERLAGDLRDEDGNPLHLTLCALEGPELDQHALLQVVERVAKAQPPLRVPLTPGPGALDLPAPHKAVTEPARMQLEGLRDALQVALGAAGFKVVSWPGPFKAHVSLPEADAMLEGAWTARELEVWGWPETVRVPLTGDTERTLQIAAALEQALGGHARVAACIRVDVNPPGTLRTGPGKTKEWVGETYFVRDDDRRATVAYARSDAVPGAVAGAADEVTGGASGVREVRLKPEARVLRPGSEDWLSMFADGGLPTLVDVVRQAVAGGYDAVRVGEALAILSGVALAEQDGELRKRRLEERAKQRGGWLRP